MEQTYKPLFLPFQFNFDFITIWPGGTTLRKSHRLSLSLPLSLSLNLKIEYFTT